MDPKDLQCLKKLTTNTLFCKYCYRPFLHTEVREDLIAPFRALLDLISGLMFVLLPIAYVPLVVIFSFLALKDKIISYFDDDVDKRTLYMNSEFDKAYFAE